MYEVVVQMAFELPPGSMAFELPSLPVIVAGGPPPETHIAPCKAQGRIQTVQGFRKLSSEYVLVVLDSIRTYIGHLKNGHVQTAAVYKT